MVKSQHKIGRYYMYTQFIFVISLQLVSSQLPFDQVSTMKQVYEIFKNNSTDSSFVWGTVSKDSNPCSWNGVNCTPDNSSITELNFRKNSIYTNEFLPTVCKIETLVSLDVSINHLSRIPDGFFTMCGNNTGLKVLNFSKNELDGSLPSFSSGFGALEHLDLSINEFVGEIDSQLEGLDSLKSLNLSHNLFTGTVPTKLGRLNALEEIHLSVNQFTGEIPAQIVKYSNLKLIDLSLNKLSGSIPDNFGSLANLGILVLSLNNLSGEIPNSISNITTLSRFTANQNSFSGSIASGLTLYLRNLDLSYNKLTGNIPMDLLSGPNLQSLDLSYNQLEGPIPKNISKNMVRLRLGSNSLIGLLPDQSLKNLAELTYLELDKNSLTGNLPSELGSCKKLALLDLSRNQFSGHLPPFLGDLTNLQVLNLQFNNFIGKIPEEITLLNRLEKMNISRNYLNGSIPLSISNLKSLKNLDLQWNDLTGQIPNSIGSLTSLIELQLGMNQLSGPVPLMPTNLQIALNLSYNLFEGSIPITLSRLSVLEVLDLSNNKFSGEIPNFLTRMTSLTRLVLSNNQLSGFIPNFKPFVTVDTEGNNVTTKVTDTSPAHKKKKKKSIAVDILIAFTTAAMAAGLLMMIALFISRRYYYRINDENSPQEIVLGNFLTPNAIHRSNIDFSKAMESISVPWNIVLKTRFSTYYKTVMPSGASYFVKKLNWSDKIFQFGSHERFKKELEILGKLNNSNVMIPLAYFLTVDSACMIYDFAPEGTLSDAMTTLAWVNRYSVAIGVAQGLAFLHSCQILLFDLSSKSILLKSLNEPRVGDIELCKVIDPSKSTGSLSTVAGSVGYIPPEYAYTMRVTEAGNVYSFGVILLELVTGKPAVSGGTELAKWVLSNENRHDHILDFSVSKTSVGVRSQMLAVLKVALACVSIAPETRPNMKSVLRMLLNAR